MTGISSNEGLCPHCDEELVLSGEDLRRSQIVCPVCLERFSKKQFDVHNEYPSCPHCGEKIRRGAQKCKHCKEFLDGRDTETYFDEEEINEDDGVKQEESQQTGSLSIADTYFSSLKKFAELSGRASRREYWIFYLCNIVMWFFLMFVENSLGLFPYTETYVLSTLFSLVVIIPGISVGVRRLHDVDKSGWWMLVGLIPFVGPIILLIFYLSKGSTGPNQYGDAPIY